MDYSEITDYLYIGTTPQREDYDLLRDLGVRLVINMRVERPPLVDTHHKPMKTLWLPTFDSPLIPIPMRALRKGVESALQTIEEGGKVYTHCAAGAHRGVAMGSAILIARGYSAEEAMDLIAARRSQADARIWYIRRRIARFAESWNHRQEQHIP